MKRVLLSVFVSCSLLPFARGASDDSCPDQLRSYADAFRPYAFALLVTKVPIETLSQTLSQPELRIRRRELGQFQWQRPRFELGNRSWAGRMTLGAQSSHFQAGGQALWRELSKSERRRLLQESEASLSRFPVRSTNWQTGEYSGGNADSAVLVFDLTLLDEGWFELKSPVGDGLSTGILAPDFQNPHLKPFLPRINGYSSLGASRTDLALFADLPLVFIDFNPPGDCLRIAALLMEDASNIAAAEKYRHIADEVDTAMPDVVAPERFWRHLRGVLIHSQSPQLSLARKEVQLGLELAPEGRFTSEQGAELLEEVRRFPELSR